MSNTPKLLHLTQKYKWVPAITGAVTLLCLLFDDSDVSSSSASEPEHNDFVEMSPGQ